MVLFSKSIYYFTTQIAELILITRFLDFKKALLIKYNNTSKIINT